MVFFNSGAMGQSLNIPQKVAINNALKKLKLTGDDQSVQFKGKIMGKEKDYFLATGFSMINGKILKNFYFSNDDGVNFSKLPEIDDWVREKSALLIGLFSGNVGQTYRDPSLPKISEDDEDEEEEEEEEEDEEGGENKTAPRKINELERLAYTAQAIDNDCCVHLKGLVEMTPTGQLHAGPSFYNLTPKQQGDIDNYVLLRNPKSPQTLLRIRKLGLANNADCFDKITDDQPQGAWSLQQADDGSVKLRSLVWPGYEFVPNGWNSQSLYFGTGQKNNDLLFMI